MVHTGLYIYPVNGCLAQYLDILFTVLNTFYTQMPLPMIFGKSCHYCNRSVARAFTSFARKLHSTSLTDVLRIYSCRCKRRRFQGVCSSVALARMVVQAEQKCSHSFANVGLVFLIPAIIESLTSLDWIMDMLYAAT